MKREKVQPKAVVVGYNRTKTIQYICIKCHAEYFPQKTHDFLCDDCRQKGFDEKDFILENNKVVISNYKQEVPIPCGKRKYSQKNYYKIYQRDGFQCQYCGSNKNLTIDHIIPYCYGGNNDIDNLAVACFECNITAGSNVFDTFEEKRKYILTKRKIFRHLDSAIVKIAQPTTSSVSKLIKKSISVVVKRPHEYSVTETAMLKTKNWKQYKNSYYLISKEAKIYSCKSKKYLKIFLDSFGYPIVGLRIDSYTYKKFVSRIVMIAHKGYSNDSNKNQIAYIDGNKKNCKLENLEWQIQIKNTIHGSKVNKLNRSHKGSENSRSKLTEDQVRIIRELKKSGKLNENTKTGYVVFDIDNFLSFVGIHKRTLKSILDYKTWTHI